LIIDKTATTVDNLKRKIKTILVLGHLTSLRDQQVAYPLLEQGLFRTHRKESLGPSAAVIVKFALTARAIRRFKGR